MAFFNNNLSASALSSSHNNQHEVVLHHQRNLKDIGRVLCNTVTKCPIQCLIMIDNLQHLAIDYHFKDEIKFLLSIVYNSLEDAGDYSLSDVSLGFRLLRQQGYHVTTDVFKKFVNEDGKFAEKLIRDDITGMISLYQASEFAIEGDDDVLDYANVFIRENMQPTWIQDQASTTVVNDSIKHPYHKSLARFKVKNYINSCENDQGTTYDVLLQEVAKMDFNIVQNLHQRELLQVTSWWKELGLAKKMEFARDQPVKWYMWSMATLADPIFSEERIDLTKPIALVYLMDDIFDIYGTLDELILFTEAINKWERIPDIDELPYCMKIFLKALYDITNEISSKILKKHGWNPINSLVNAWRRLCDAFLVEAKWFASAQLPTSEEYLKNGLISSGVHVIFVHIYFLLGQGINKKSVDLLDSFPGLISCPAMILRLWDDLGTAKDENQQGYDGSYIDCYMKEHKSLTTESAQEHVINMISNTWKTLNKEYLLPNSFPLSFKKAALNAARMVSMMYSYDANQRLPILEKQIKSMLYESIPLNDNSHEAVITMDQLSFENDIFITCEVFGDDV